MQAFNADHMLPATFSCRSSHALKATLQPGEWASKTLCTPAWAAATTACGVSDKGSPAQLLHFSELSRTTRAQPEPTGTHKKLARSRVVAAGAPQVRQAGWCSCIDIPKYCGCCEDVLGGFQRALGVRFRPTRQWAS